MKIDPFTRNLVVDNKNYIYNLRTGSIDEIDNILLEQILELKEVDSFSDTQEIITDKRNFNKLIDKGYITSLSNKELNDYIKHKFENYTGKLKNGKKTPSLLLDNIVGQKWCLGKVNNNKQDTYLTEESIENVLEKIKKNHKTDTINIWFDLKSKSFDLSKLYKLLKKNNLTPDSFFISIDNEEEIDLIKNELKTAEFENFGVNLKTTDDKHKYSFFEYKNETFTEGSSENLFLENELLFCPYLYKTYFIDVNGDMHYCLSKLSQQELSIGNIFDAHNKVSLGLSEQMQNICNDQNDMCAYSIACSKMCDCLNNKVTECNYDFSTDDEKLCPVFGEIENNLKVKLHSLIE